MGTSPRASRGGSARDGSSTALRPGQLAARPLTQLLATLSESDGLDEAQICTAEGVTISGLSLNSKLVSIGDLYVGLAGAKTHGAVFAEQAIRAGAVAVLTDAAGAVKLRENALTAPVITVGDPRAAMAELAAELYGHPAGRLAMCAITGTNGKTTTAYLLEAALAAVGRDPGVIGTIGYRVGGRTLVGDRTTVTTPESPDLQSLLALMAEQGADSIAMEVSSHAMVLRRTEPVIFDVAAFTNLGRDHLDFHADMADYFEAKASLFTPAHARAAVVNIDSEWGERLAQRVRRAQADTGSETPLVTTGRDIRADFRLVRTRHHPDQSQDLVISTPRGELCTTLGLPGEYNADNAVTALAIIDSLGLDPFRAQAGLRDVQVPGRMQRLALPAGSPTVIVDFAHTPQAITSVLGALRVGNLGAGGAGGAGGIKPGRVIAVLGAGGDRDVAKRGPMGAEAARGADVVIVTDDNPRGEDPAAIRGAVLTGAVEVAGVGGDVLVLDGGDRRAAIRQALQLAETRDVIAVLGKGHERGQEIAGAIVDFSDADVVLDLAAESGSAAPGTDPQVAR